MENGVKQVDHRVMRIENWIPRSRESIHRTSQIGVDVVVGTRFNRTRHFSDVTTGKDLVTQGTVRSSSWKLRIAPRTTRNTTRALQTIFTKAVDWARADAETLG